MLRSYVGVIVVQSPVSLLLLCRVVMVVDVHSGVVLVVTRLELVHLLSKNDVLHLSLALAC